MAHDLNWLDCSLWVLLTALFCQSHMCYSRTAEEWKSRVIYQLLTDRFGPDGSSPAFPCTDLRSYCGGTFAGVTQRLDYIQELGANAIWISPFVENTNKGYHGYWAKDLYSVNPHMGTKEELLDLVKACHQRDIWVMMDVVANHMGYPQGFAFNITDFVPFNETWHYHDDCAISDWSNQTEVELCWLAGLPDLNQSEPYVRDTLLSWIHDMTLEYGFDGYRVDTAVEVPKWFWEEFTPAAGVFLMGEANNGDRTCYTGGYQGPLPSVLNFPVYWALRKALNEQRPMTTITDSLAEQRKCFKDLSVLGLFVDNHDFPRFLNLSYDTTLLHNALTYVLFGQGIPIIYYGTEQDFHGGHDPNDRESLWPYYSRSSPTYKFISEMSKVRRRLAKHLTAANQVELYADNELLVFTRGSNKQVLVVVTNVGQGTSINVVVTSLLLKDGTTYRNVEKAEDTLVVRNTSFTISLPNGRSKVYVLQAATNTATAQECAMLTLLLANFLPLFFSILQLF